MKEVLKRASRETHLDSLNALASILIGILIVIIFWETGNTDYMIMLDWIVTAAPKNLDSLHGK